jgi:hypothetical protein
MLAFDGPTRRWEPKRLRLRIFAVAGRMICGGRRLLLRLDRHWPCALHLAAALSRLQALAPGRLTRAAGLRWPVEEDFALGKDCFGLDQSQVRLYAAIARHTVLVMAALAACAVTAALLRDRTDTQALPPVRPGQPPPADPGMIPLTVPETARLLSEATRVCYPPGHREHWSDWRRCHQARARWYHQRARLARDAEIALAA